MLGAGAGDAFVGASVGGALAVGVTVVTVSGGNGAAGGGADGVVAAGRAVVGAGWLVVAGRATVVDTDPLSPPPRMTTVQITATSVTGQLNCSITDAAGAAIAVQNNNTMIANCTK